ncbi:thioredoxin-like protein [Dendrothele bispora CBS 962.96]|uniref:Thioredoxin-like protein n=1 Tax=Dendrothele bispora (strain CBS 962.96) TaxID=1314807 RepID=A0A4S8L3H5_DENBC|nr:thioredoxin-like protein [Dendrothele bispora CBS 962.96]
MFSATLRSTRLPLALIRHARAFHASSSAAEHYPNADFGTFKRLTTGPDSEGRLVLVDFYADWCKPCHMLSPVLEKISKDPEIKSGSGRPIDVVTVNTESDEGFQLGQRFKVRALPTVIAFRDGKDVEQFVGALPDTGVRQFLQRV